SDILRTRNSRREVLAGGLGAAVAAFIGPPGDAHAQGNPQGKLPLWLDRRPGFGPKKPLIGFRPIAVADGSGPVPTISPDYEYQILIPWGESLIPGGPTYDGNPITRPSVLEQTMQI